METLHEGVDPRTGEPVASGYANWTTHPNNPQQCGTKSGDPSAE
jgi:dihydropyrimidine dehydrogenase (NAD+) subunit PreA